MVSEKQLWVWLYLSVYFDSCIRSGAEHLSATSEEMRDRLLPQR
jgi:hypothetical protein